MCGGILGNVFQSILSPIAGLFGGFSGQTDTGREAAAAEARLNAKTAEEERKRKVKAKQRKPVDIIQGGGENLGG